MHRIGILLIGATMAFAGPFQSFPLNLSNGCCGSGPYGTVMLTQNGSNEVDFSVTLNDPFVFISSGFPGTFAFNLNVAPANLTITLDPASIAAGFAGSAGSNLHPKHMSAFGYFDYVITTDSAHSNPSHPLGQSLAFSVVDHAGAISITDFESVSINGGQEAFFAADIKNTTMRGNETGLVGTEPGGTPQGQSTTPEPATMLIAATGLLCLGAVRRKRA